MGLHALLENFPDHLAEIKPTDTSLKAAVLRCLQAYVDTTHSKDDRNAMIYQEHLDAFQQISLHQHEQNLTGWRPEWEDIPAAYLIQACIIYVFKKFKGSPLVRLSPPSKLFDEFNFHMTLFNLRQATKQPTEAKSTGLQNGQSKTPKSSGADSQKKKKGKPARLVLPIDEHEELILHTIENNRVTIIQGETGCGKSTRVPLMVLKAPRPDRSMSDVRLFISQPRRIAAKALVERLRATEPEIGKTLALRMGHGVREYESSSTKAWFVTTGYLVRLLANHPEKFEKCSHIIIDECHERSVDTDILCLLCRRLLQSNQRIRLVLMSATLAAKLYQEYFDLAQPPIKVGARRFPIQEVFVEDLPSTLHLSPKDKKAVRQIEAECRKTMCISPPSNSAMDSLYNLAAQIAISVGKPGKSVLIFVPGMNDIVAISELIEKTFVPGVTFTCIPVHSDVPFEDQLTIFEESDEVKVIIATK
jgi:ATP-dependent RNA helicase DHX57